MAYITLTNTTLTEAQATSLNDYISNEVTAGNTDGIKISVTRTGVVDGDNQPLVLNQRSWKDSASATAYIAYNSTVGGTIIYSDVVTPL